jgi:hypothetical protein
MMFNVAVDDKGLQRCRAWQPSQLINNPISNCGVEAPCKKGFSPYKGLRVTPFGRDV